jgi:hypothetical protein
MSAPNSTSAAASAAEGGSIDVRGATIPLASTVGQEVVTDCALHTLRQLLGSYLKPGLPDRRGDLSRQHRGGCHALGR